MSLYCPVCNGMQPLSATCPKCRKSADDFGRIADLLGPYSPYRPIDEMNMIADAGYPLSSRCLHCAGCPHCGETFSLFVEERRG